MKLLRKLFTGNRLTLSINDLPRRLSLMDIGARGGVQWPWDHLDSNLLSVVLVEPDPIEAEKLQRELNATHNVILPFVLWREGKAVSLNLNRSPGTSSVFLPNRQFLDQFPDANRFDVLRTIDISTVTIDGLASSSQIPTIDFAKIDVQGSELAILEGGRNHLAANLVGLEIEVEFAELYSGQPLFGEVETFVREQLGLELWDLSKVYWKYEQGRHTPGPTKGRLVFGDALFLRPLSGTEAWLATMQPNVAKEKVIMLVITALAYGYTDFATSLLSMPSLDRYFDAPRRQGLQFAVNSVGAGFRPFRYGSGPLFAIFDAFAKAVKPTHAGWASRGHGLGSHRQGPFWL